MTTFPLRRTLLAAAAAATLGLAAAAALPQSAEAQTYVYRGQRYCFYVDGWNGPGWYRCGYRWRRGLGWGGVYDWGLGFGWHYPAWERRHHPAVPRGAVMPPPRSSIPSGPVRGPGGPGGPGGPAGAVR